MNPKLMFKAAIVTFLMPGTAVVLIPYYILRQSSVADWPEMSGGAVLAAIAGLSGLAVLLHCVREFAVHGKGTLAPIDPPKVLVVRGFYRYTRNPMYLAIIIVLLSEALFFDNLSLLMYAAGALLCFHLFVIFYEERRLRATFGESYKEYLMRIPRWRFTMQGFNSRTSPNEPYA